LFPASTFFACSERARRRSSRALKARARSSWVVPFMLPTPSEAAALQENTTIPPLPAVMAWAHVE